MDHSHVPVAKEGKSMAGEWMRRWLILGSFAAFFAFAWLVYLRTSSVERAPLPNIDDLVRQIDFLDTRVLPVIAIVGGSRAPLVQRALALAASTVASKHLAPITTSVSLEGNYDYEWRPLSETGAVQLKPLLLDLRREHGAQSEWRVLADNTLERVGCMNDEQALQTELRYVLDAVLSVYHGDVFALPVSPAAHYRLSFTLLTADPALTSHIWDFAPLQAAYIDPLIAALAPAIKLTVDSQVVQFATIVPPVSVQRGVNASTNATFYYVPSSALANFIGRTEFNIESPFSRAAIQLLAYVPPVHHQPLVIVEKESVDQADSFVVPSWGGVVILNHADTDTDSHTNHSNALLSAEASASLMRRFVVQLRRLLGLRSPFESTVPLALDAWETDAIIQRSLAHYLRTTVAELKSLYQLLEDTPHMPVSQTIADRCTRALRMVDAARHACMSGDFSSCSRFARSAHSISSRAFYDASLMPTLHFPPEHQYAVYAPLFAPIVVPVLGALLAAVKGGLNAARAARSPGAR